MIDKERGIFKSRERGVFVYDIETNTFGSVPADFEMPRVKRRKKYTAHPTMVVSFGDIFLLDECLKKSGFHKVIDAVRYRFLYDFANLYGEKNLPPQTIERIFKLLSCAFRQAVKWELVGKNPFELSDALPKIKYKKRDIWDAETISKALDECRDGKLYAAMNLSFACSMREGEILGLTWDMVHISDEDIKADNTYIDIQKDYGVMVLSILANMIFYTFAILHEQRNNLFC